MAMLSDIELILEEVRSHSTRQAENQEAAT